MLEHRNRIKLRIGNDSHGYVSCLAGQQQILNTGHCIDRIGNQFILQGEVFDVGHVIFIEHLLPDPDDINFRVIDPFPVGEGMGLFNSAMQRISKPDGWLVDAVPP